VDFPDDPEMRVSHETIYQGLYVQGRGALSRELTTCLRTGRALRKPRRKAAERRGRIAGMVSISQRPPEVDDRAVPGHWEGDLITGTENKSAIGTLVERATGYLLLLHLPDAHGAIEVQDAMVEAMGSPGAPRTLTRATARTTIGSYPGHGDQTATPTFPASPHGITPQTTKNQAQDLQSLDVPLHMSAQIRSARHQNPQVSEPPAFHAAHRVTSRVTRPQSAAPAKRFKRLPRSSRSA